MAKEKMSYSESMKELEQLMKEMEYGDITVDELSEKVKRSALLIKFCKSKLKNTEEDVESILKDMEANTDS